MLDHNQLFVGVGQTRRILSAEVAHNGEWVPVHPDSTYTIGGQSYILTSKGASGALQYMQEVECDHIGDVQAVLNYLNQIGSVSAEQYGKAQDRVVCVD
jgi:hypothetical protein